MIASNQKQIAFINIRRLKDEFATLLVYEKMKLGVEVYEQIRLK